MLQLSKILHAYHRKNMSILWTPENASQEAVSAWTHGVGFLASIPCGLFMIGMSLVYRQEMVWACCMYCVSFTLMYLCSTLSHAVKTPELRHRCRAFDQGCIYLFIVGTFTPFACAYMEGWPRTVLLILAWLAAGIGFYSKVIAEHRINNMAAISYILLGWIPSMILLGYVPNACFLAMAFGGVLYTIGTVFLQNDHRHWLFHTVWHLAVILASGCHYAAIMTFTILP